MSFVYMQVILHESTDNTEDICNFREKIQNFQNKYIPVAIFNSSGTPLFVVLKWNVLFIKSCLRVFPVL